MNRMRKAKLSQLPHAPRCGARTRSGTPCRRAAIQGRNRCRLHGGLSTGAPKGEKNGNYSNGDWTAEVLEERKWLRNLIKTCANPGVLEMTGRAKLPATVTPVPSARARVKLRRVNCNRHKPYPPAGQEKVWWDRLKAAMGTTSSDFVNATLVADPECISAAGRRDLGDQRQRCPRLHRRGRAEERGRGGLGHSDGVHTRRHYGGALTPWRRVRDQPEHSHDGGCRRQAGKSVRGSGGGTAQAEKRWIAVRSS